MGRANWAAIIGTGPITFGWNSKECVVVCEAEAIHGSLVHAS